MINRNHKLSVTKQAKLLGISRSSVYYMPKPLSPRDQALMTRIDQLHLKHPFAGARMLRDLLRQEGHQVGRMHVSTLMKKMCIDALYCRPRTTRKHPGHKVYPYLLRHLEITRPNQVWAMDISYIPMAHGFIYLVAVLDWRTRRVLSWKLSTTMDTSFCTEAVEDAIERYGTPEIMNTDQGSQFTSDDFIKLIKGNGIRISMDGKGAWRDNVFVERLWRSVKYEDIYLHAYRTLAEVREGLSRYFQFYNSRRPHSSLDGATPDQVYFETPLPQAA